HSGAAAKLAEAWREQNASVGSKSSSAPRGDGVYGRIVYLRSDADLTTVTLVDPSRRVMFVADGTSWAGRNFGLGAREILLRNGVQAEWIEHEITKGTRFKLVFFEDDGMIWKADWDGVERAVEAFHPRAAEKICPHWETIRNTSWADLEAQFGVTFDVLEQSEGPMTEERYLAAEDTPVTARRFLASTLSLNRHFQGTGYTFDERADSGDATAEFFAANRPLSSLPAAQVVDLEP
ncbi:unnamed protein product, partial [Symbiodinium pilosum]